MTELRMQHEVDQSTLQYEIKQLYAKLRLAYESQSLEELFLSLEHDVIRLTKDNQRLRAQRLQFEDKLLDQSVMKCTVCSNGDSEGDSQQQYHNTMQRLIKRLKNSGREREALKTAYESLKAKERHFGLHEKLSKDASRRLKLTFHELQKYKKALEQERIQHMEVNRQFQALQSFSHDLKDTNESLITENQQLNQQAQIMRQRVQELEQEQQRVNKLYRAADRLSSASPIPSRHGYKPVALHHPVGRSPSTIPASNVEKSPVIPSKSYEAKHLSRVRRSELISNSQIGQQENIPTHNYSIYNVIHAGNTETPSSEIEAILSTLQNTMVSNNPALLPLVRKLEQEIHTERMRALDQRSKLLDKINIFSASSKNKDK
jgi:hypothetical protein